MSGNLLPISVDGFVPRKTRVQGVCTYDSSPKSYSLRAGAHGKRDVLDIGAGNVLAGVGEDACSDAEFGVWAYVRF